MTQNLSVHVYICYYRIIMSSVILYFQNRTREGDGEGAKKNYSAGNYIVRKKIYTFVFSFNLFLLTFPIFTLI